MKKKASILYYIILTIIFIIIAWFKCIPINPFLSDGFIFIISYLFFISMGILVSTSATSISSVLRGNRLYFNKKSLIIVTSITGIPIIIFILMGILGSPLFSANSYKNQLGEAEEREFTSDMQVIDVNQIPIVDIALARNLAEKKLGEKPALGSQVVLGEPTIQNVNNKLVWVVPLEHSGLFKWLNNLDGTPGYIVVSATDQKDVTYIDTYKVKYQPSSFFTQDLYRHVRFGKGISDGLTDFSFEIDDEGKPYWVVTTYHNSRFLSLPEADGVIIVDASTGKQEKYGINDVPKWVDRVQPRKFIENQIINQGEYVNGIFNFSNKGKYTVSEGNAVVYNNGSCYMFTGLTSVGNDEAATRIFDGGFED